jgi:rhamnogalacturonan acetylesterase
MTVTKLAQPGDFVVVEFSHNDGGAPKPSDNGRSNCPDTGDVTHTTKIGAVVKAFDAYMTEATQTFGKLRAHVIISSQTPNSHWESGTFNYAASSLIRGAALAAKNVANGNITFVDHGQYAANANKALGKEAVGAFYPNDHIHTSPAGADVVSKEFVKCVVCVNILSKNYVKNEMSTILGDCIWSCNKIGRRTSIFL